MGFKDKVGYINNRDDILVRGRNRISKEHG